MATLSPIYTPENCSFSDPLEWGLSVFWQEPIDTNDWFQQLTEATESDGVRLLGHRFKSATVSQFAVSTRVATAPLHIVQRVKGRLQHLVRKQRPKAFKKNYAIRSFGHVIRDIIEKYVEAQTDHHPMADPRVQSRLQRFQIHIDDVDLAKPQTTTHAVYWYNLHIVLVHVERWVEVREQVLSEIHDMIVKVCGIKGYALSRAGILADHVHILVSCPIDIAPVDVAMSFMNNLAFVHGMKAVYQFGGFIGTVGEYDQRAVGSETSVHGGKPHGAV